MAPGLAEERIELLRQDAERSGRSRGGRQRVGLWLVGLGFRIAGPRVSAGAVNRRERLSSA